MVHKKAKKIRIGGKIKIAKKYPGVSIVTKRGDKGETFLCGLERVTKDDVRVEACGTLDELCSYLGMSKSIMKNVAGKKLIESIQKDLFVIGAQIATKPKLSNKLKRRMDESYVSKLEKAIGKIEHKRLFEGRCFHLPGENRLSALLDIARAVARRAERRIVTLDKKGLVKNRYIIIYLNRLSDLLYLLARCCEKKHRKVEDI